MNINFPNLDEARAAARLQHNIKRLNRHDDKQATMKVIGNGIAVRIDFANSTTISKEFMAANVESISEFCDFLEGSPEADGIATLREVSA